MELCIYLDNIEEQLKALKEEVEYLKQCYFQREEQSADRAAENWERIRRIEMAHKATDKSTLIFGQE